MDNQSESSTLSEKALPPGQGAQRLFAMLFVVLTVLVLSKITTETTFSSGKSVFAQPRFWPAVSLIGMLLFGVGHLIAVRHKSALSTLSELFTWARAIEYLLWFMVYVALVPIIGYLLSTLLFTVLLAFRQGYHDKRSLIAAAGAGLLVVLVFKTALSVKIPGGAVYEYLPGALRSFMIVNF